MATYNFLDEEHSSAGHPGGCHNSDFLFGDHLPGKPNILKNCSVVQLIVGKPCILDATQLLENLDLDICKCAITTDKFMIPRPFQTFMQETMLIPAHRRLLDAFMAAWDVEMDSVDDALFSNAPFPPVPVDVRNIIASIPANVWVRGVHARIRCRCYFWAVLVRVCNLFSHSQV